MDEPPSKKTKTSYTDIVFLAKLLNRLIDWMMENESKFPAYFFGWMLGDQFAWNYGLTLVEPLILLSFSHEYLHLVMGSLDNKEETWKKFIEDKKWKWFKNIYHFRHCVPSKLRHMEIFTILRDFRKNPLESAIKYVKNCKRVYTSNILEVEERSSKEIEFYKGKVIKNKDLLFSKKEAKVAGDFVFEEAPSDTIWVSDRLNVIIKDKHTGEIIGGRIKNAIPNGLRNHIKMWSWEICKVRPNISRSKSARRAICSYMGSFGANTNLLPGRGGLLQFAHYKLNKQSDFGDANLNEEVDILVHSYGYSILQEIIIAVCLEHYPQILLDFLCATNNHAYLGVKSDDIKKDIGPLAWTLYVTCNYKVMLHEDVQDSSKYTMAIVSNKNKINKGGQFHFLSHGVAIDLCEGDFFWFQGRYLHGTSFREVPLQQVYVAALVVNQKVTNIVNRDLQLIEANPSSETTTNSIEIP